MDEFAGRTETLEWIGRRAEGALTIALRGELDLSVAGALGEIASEVAAAPELIVVIDLAHLSFIDSTGLRWLIDLRRECEQRSARLLLSRLSGPVSRLLEVVGLGTWFEYVQGEGPARTFCPNCERELLGAVDRCPQCGSAF